VDALRQRVADPRLPGTPTLIPLLARLKSGLDHALEGELAKLPPHERREQQRRQIQLLHWPLANLLLALAVLETLRVAVMAFEQVRPALAWQGALAVGLLVLAIIYRRLISLRRRVWLGFGFMILLLACLLVPVQSWQGAPLLSLAGFLLLPAASLPLLVRPRAAWTALLMGTGAMLAVLWLMVDAPIADKRTFAFYFLVSVTAGLVLRRARANLATRLDREVETLWQRAVSDPLTGLLNRHGWMNLAGTAMRDAVVAGRQPAVLFIDVDHFKRTNDAHGHLAGDELLRQLGQLIGARIGASEFAARLGGEEFACLLPDSSEAQAERFARRIAAEYRHHAASFGSTLSIGVSTYGDGDLLNDLLARADAALYEAKHRGRDQIVVAR
jgi:diguanylate cyclase (GGDEF)-like protein